MRSFRSHYAVGLRSPSLSPPRRGDVIKIRLRRGFNTSIIRGLATSEQLDVRLDGERIKLFTVGGECVGSSEPRCKRGEGREAGATPLASPYETTADDGLEVDFP